MITLKERYANYREEIRSYMEYVEESLLDKYGEIYPHYLVSLDTLAMNMDIMFKAKETFDKEGFNKIDHQGMIRKSGAVQVFNTAQQAALKIMNSFGLNPMAEARIKTNKSQRAMDDYVASLTGLDNAQCE